MKKIFEVSEIDNGFIVNYGNQTKSYQVAAINNQLPNMFLDILKVLGEHKNYSVVTANDAAKLVVRS